MLFITSVNPAKPTEIMFIFSQFNFLTLSPRTVRATGGSLERLGVGAAVTQEQKEGRGGGSQRKRKRSQERKGALEVEWR